VIAALRARVEHLVDQLRRRSLKQQKVAELGRRAVAGASVPELSAVAARSVTEAMELKYAAVLRAVPGQPELQLEAGEGWEPPGMTGGQSLSREDPPVQRAFESGEPVVVEEHELAALRRRPGALQDVTSAFGVAIPGRSEPFGLLAAFTPEPVEFTSSQGDFMQAIAHVLGDAVERHRVEQEAAHQALHDRLTGIPNRSLFTDRLEEALIRSHDRGSLAAVCFLDIDDFKLVNDGFGHGVGDELLRAFGPRLRQALVMTDTVARFGGDEFAVLCEDIEGERHAVQIALRLLDALAEPFEIDGVEHRVTACVGVTLSSGADGPEELLAQADAAMYLAKEKTRGGYQFYDRDLRQRVRMRLQFEGALRAAPDRDELHLVVQPIVSLPDGIPVGSEALLRWRHPELGPVSPSEFIPVAEETGAIVPIGEWVLAEAFRLAARWRTDPVLRRWLPLHVNISPRQLDLPEFATMVEAQVKQAGARVSDLALEITEHALFGNAVRTVLSLERLQTLGFRIVLDDFGTGYSSLSHLKRFPLDVVKIDRLFTSNMTAERRDEAIVAAVLGMADAFGLDAVAEGIETPEQAAQLTDLGCRIGQGFHFGRPVSARALTTSPARALLPELSRSPG
jgi:diguanylate cyclase (GGDEF)-like protein